MAAVLPDLVSSHWAGTLGAGTAKSLLLTFGQNNFRKKFSLL